MRGSCRPRARAAGLPKVPEHVGLHAYIFGTDRERAFRLASRIEAGRVAINGGREPISPFGGFKQSGLGREYGSYGLEGFLEPRSVMA